MKKTIKLAVVAALALGATSAFATNGSNLIAMGAKARGMGGAGIGVSHGAESAISNAALITTVEGTEISFGGTIFMPEVTNSQAGGASKDSAADMSVIPEVSIASKINNNFYAGIGMWGTAGMGVDYRTSAAQWTMVTNLQLMQFGVPLAYTTDGFSVAITPVLQYGSLDIDYNAAGAGVAQDLQFGYNLGVSYVTNDFTIGAVYKSQIDMEYTDVLSSTVGPMTGSAYTNNKLSTPAEYGIGASYKMDAHTIAIDYKNIKWSDAKGYQDFLWEDQDVIAIGYEYATSNWALRAGYNHSSNPIKEASTSYMNATNGMSGAVVNTFNLLGFPATVESHYTIGGTYNISDKTSVDIAYVYADAPTESFTGSDGGMGTQNIKTDHEQTSLSLAVNYNF